MTSLILHGDPFSASTRFLTCVMEVLGLRYELKVVDVRRGENLTPAFQKVRVCVCLHDLDEDK